ncbi:MAG: glycoside-pentoside-hexuronide (GPH):cation symporter [Eubacterium sp.]|nr:glycoside-pentoside-hexuronide (GPH):cation symporter [Eubacterium sp.]
MDSKYLAEQGALATKLDEVGEKKILSTEKLSVREKLCYGLGTAGEQFPFFFVNCYLFFFFNVILGISAVTVGTIMLISRIWDAINDPLMGMIADRTRTRWGVYRPWAFFATIPMGLFLVLTFTDFHLGMTGRIIVAAITYIGFGMSNTASIIPLGSMVNVLTADYNERSQLGSFREFGSAIGNTLTSIIVPAILSLCAARGLEGASSYTVTAIVLGLFTVAVLALTFFNTKERIEPPKENVSLIKSFGTLKGNAPAWSLIFAFFFVCGYSVFRNTMNAYYGVYYLENDAYPFLLTVMAIAPFFILYFIPGITAKIGKRNTFIIGCALIAVSGAIFMIAKTNMTMNYVAAFVAGWGQVLSFSSTWSMIPDAADYGEWKNGVRAPAFIYSLVNFSLKLSMSIFALVISFGLAHFGFDQAQTTQSDMAINGIYLLNSVPMIAVGILAIICILPFKINAEEAEKIQIELQKRHAKEDSK